MCRKLNDAKSQQEKDDIVQCTVLILMTASDGLPNADALLRRGRMEARLRIAVNSRTQVGATTPISELTPLRDLQEGRSNADATVMIQFHCRRSDIPKSTDSSVGTSVEPFDSNMTFPELHEKIFEMICVRWKKCYGSTLKIDRTELRLPGNITFPDDEPGITVGEWHTKYEASELRGTYIIPPRTRMPSIKKRRGFLSPIIVPRAFSIELFIHDDVGLNVPRTPSRRKRTHNTEDGSEWETPRFKRTRRDKTPTPSASSVSLLSQDPPIADNMQGHVLLDSPRAVTQIRLRRTICTVNAGLPDLEELQSLEEGTLSPTSMDLNEGEIGRTNDRIHRVLTIGDSQYLAKQVNRMGEGCVVTVDQAFNVLIGDLVRLRRMSYFCQRFLENAINKGVDVSVFSVTDGFVIRTYANNDPDFQPVAEVPQVTGAYLVEPYRQDSEVIRYSGTLDGAREDTYLHSTMAAFMHYVAEETACRYIYADVQGLDLGQDVPVMTLFNSTTHAVNQSSGLGDIGVDGIQHFINQHQCTPICRDLNLASMETLQNTLDSAMEEQFQDVA
ncbi:kinase-like domain-containing protein [Daedaleopsis nitida]|nr:kinase-like domain-containing protein [Daedaleopsis nitida]